ncbi:MAG TPA: PKD domain-containing protein [Bacteroidia bacterium]|nr:PKD domain-containing protein [Bacteroidia bacterium]
MKVKASFILYIVLGINCLYAKAIKTLPYKSNASSTDPGNNKNKTNASGWLNNINLARSNAFVQNVGQFDDNVDGVEGKDILFREDEPGMYVYFTTKGIVYKVFKRGKVSEEEWKKYAKEHKLPSEGDDDEPKYITKTSYVKMNWDGANANPELIAEEPTDFYFNYYRPDLDKDKIFGNVKGYKKLLYKNVYPNIDIEYTIHPTDGIKYSCILHPGADVSLIKMNYSGATVSKDNSGNILLSGKFGVLTDHAPDSYKETLTSTIASSFSLNENTVSFSLGKGQNKVTQTTIIDPWTNGSPIAGFAASPDDIAVDGTNNVLIYGCNSGTGTDLLNKYNAAGVLQWQFNLSTKASYQGSQGDVQADAAGNIYTTIGLGPSFTNSYNTIKINPAGTSLLWGTATGGVSSTNMWETWTLAFNCDETMLIQSGGGTNPPGNTSNSGIDFNSAVYETVNISTGAEGTLNNNINYGEITSSIIAPNGMLYHLVSDSNIDVTNSQKGPSQGPNNYVICINPAGFSTVFIVKTGYSYVDADFKEPGSIGNNGLGASCKYLYTTDGLNLDQRSLTTGALIKTVKIPGGSNSPQSSVLQTGTALINGGIVTDKCGNVYVGTKNEIVQYDENLNQLATLTGSGIPGTVFDLALGLNGEIYACGAKGATGSTSFVAEVPLPKCVAITTTVTPGGCGSGGSATALPTFCSAPYTYSWSPGGQTTQTATNLTAGTYTVIATGTCPGYSDTATAVIVNGGGSLTLTRDSTASACTANNGSAGVVMTSGTAPYVYKWSNGITTSNITNVGAGSYCVSVTDSKGCKDSVCITVPSTGGITSSIKPSSNDSCFGDSNGTATASGANGAAPYVYTWSNGQTTAIATGLKAGSYTVTVKDANGCISTSNITITQPTVLQVKTTAIAATCNGLCNGQLISIPSGGTNPYTYLWSNAVTSASQLNACAATYSLVVTDANGCKKDTTGLIVGQPAAIVGSATPVSAQCGQADGSDCISVSSGGTAPFTYAWSNGATSTCINNVASATYTVIITDANKCTDTTKTTVPNTAGDTVKITAHTNVTCNGGSTGSATALGSGGTLPYSYSWSPGGQTNATATSLPAGTYTVTMKDGSAAGCPATDTVTITQPSLVVATPPAPQTICMGSSATLTVSAAGGTPAYSYSWAPGGLTGATVTVTPASTTTYVITTTDANNCPSVPVQVVVTVNPALKVTVTPDKATCPGGSVTIGAQATGGDGTYTYTWSPPTGLSCTACQDPGVTPAATTQYTVLVADNCGTPPVKDSVTAIIDPLPVVSFTADTLAGCDTLCVGFKDGTTIASGGLFSWSWSFGDGTTYGQQNPPVHCYGNPGVYTIELTVKSDSGCISSDTIPNMITVYSHPVAAFTASPQPATILDPTISFTDQSKDAYGIAGWYWQFEDPTDATSIMQNPQFTYADTGTYCPKLGVINIHGCVDTTQQCIVISPLFTLYIPNAFSPNHDGLNDVFLVKGTYVCGFQMYIFDRWGMQLYSSNDINKGWDGKVGSGASVAQEDTYVYLIEAVDCVNHQKHQYLGKVTIVK